MTYCVGWKHNDTVFLVADSAVTRASTPDLEWSSFGEKHAQYEGGDAGEYVAEEAIKIHHLGIGAITFSGDMRLGYAVVDELRALLESNVPPLDAFTQATSCVTSASDICAMFAYVNDESPRLATFNVKGDLAVQDGVKEAQIGSMKPAYRELTSQFISLTNRVQGTPSQMLAYALALVQSYGVFGYLIESGVGGGFCGLYVSGNEVHWQPSMLYAVTDPQISQANLVGSFAGEDVWCLFTSLGERGRVIFCRRMNGESGELYRQRFSGTLRRFEEAHFNCKFDFMAVITLGHQVVTVIELRQERNHALVSVEPHPSLPRSIGVFWQPELKRLVEESTTSTQ